MKGEYLIYGIATAEGKTGWSVIGSSIALNEAERSALVTRTAVGHLRESGFTDSYGYFGVEKAGGQEWAVFAHFYRSLNTEKTGNYFVQRDICLAPYHEFAALDADATPFLHNLPPAKTIATSGAQLNRWDLREEADPSAQRLKDELSGLRADFLADLLIAAVQETPTVIVGSPGRDLIPTLLLLLPPTLRAGVTFSTAVADPSASVRLQVMRAFPASEAKGSIVELEKQRFVSNKITTDSPAIRALFATWKKDGYDELLRQQNFIERAMDIGTRSLLEELETAQQLWVTFNDLVGEESGERKWHLASSALEQIGSLRTKVRPDVVEAVLRNVQLPSERTQLIKFIRDLHPANDEAAKIANAFARRLATVKDDEQVAESIRLYENALPRSTDDLLPALLGALEPDRRKIELALKLRKKLGDAASSLHDRVLASWAFRDPRPDSVRGFLATLGSKDDIASLRSNKALIEQIESNAESRFALALFDAFLRGDDRDLLAAKPGSEAIATLTSEEGQRWIAPLPKAALMLAGRLLPSAKADAARVLAGIFADAWEQADSTWLTAEERKAARDAVHKNNKDADRRMRVADYRRDLAEVEGTLSEQVLKLAKEWKEQRLGAEQLIEVLRPDDGSWPTASMAWSFLSELSANDVDSVKKLIESWRGKSQAEPLLRMLAVIIAMSGSGGSRSAGELLPECFDAIAELRETSMIGGEGRYPVARWKPKGAVACDLFAGLATFFHSRRYAEEQRNVLTAALISDQDRARVFLQRLQETNSAIAALVPDGESLRTRLAANQSVDDADALDAAAEVFLEKTSSGVPLIKKRSVRSMLENLRSAIKRGVRSRGDSIYTQLR
ncbi:MAG: hypothetical protein QOI24_3251 [Acidobacteriota bacterium]|jgi:hypothetical protein|nr:hypothetical protein [Acidobacteriota bacterium]